jgi:phage-related protein
VLGGAAFGTLKLALSGVGDAFKAALSGDYETFIAGIEDLSGSAGEVAYELFQMSGAFTGLKDVAQDAFFQPLVGQLHSLFPLLQTLRQGIGEVAGDFGRFASEILAVGQTASAISLVRNSFETLHQIMSDIQSGTLRDLLASMAYFANSTLPAFDGLGSAVNRLAEQFSVWLTTAAASGTALQWIENAKDVFKQLGAILADLGGVVSAVFRAMQTATGDTLGVLGQLLDGLHAFVDSARGQEILVEVFRALSQVAAAFLPVIKAVAGAVGELAPGIASLAQAVGPLLTAAIKAVAPALSALVPGITAVIGGIRAGVEALGPALEPLGRTLGQALGLLAPLFKSIGQAIAAALPGISNFLVVVATGLTSLGPALVPLGRAIGDLVAALRPLFGGLVNGVEAALPGLRALITALGTGLAAAAPALVALGKAFGGILTALAPVLPVLGQVVSVAGTHLGAAIRAVLPSLRDLVKTLGPSVGDALKALVDGIGAMAPGLIKLIEGVGQAVVAIGPMLGPLGKELGGVLAALGSGLALVVPEIAKIAVALAPALAAALRALGPALAALGPGLVAVAENLAEAFASEPVRNGLLALGKGLSDLLVAAAPLIPHLTRIAGILLQLVGGALTNFSVALGPIIDALGEAMAPALDSVSRALEQLIPYMEPVYKAFGDIGAALIREVLPPILNLIPTMIDSLIPAFIDLAEQLKPLVPLLADFAVAFVRDVLPALLPMLPELSKMSVEFARIGIVLSQLVADVAPYIKRLIEIFQYLYDRLVGHSIIPDLINSMVGWFTDGVQRIKNTVSAGVDAVFGFFRDLPGRIIGALGNLGSLLWNSGQSIVQGLIDGLYSKLQEAANAAADILNRIRAFFPFSPAKQGPFSGKGWTLFSGQSMAQDLAKGLSQSEGLVAKAAQGLVGAASGSLTSSISMAAPQASMPIVPQGGGVTFVFNFAGQPLIGEHEIARVVIAALNQATGRGFNLGWKS